MSYNNISGEIPSGLPPNATFINLADNKLASDIPMSLPSLKNLKYLNVSYNNLFGVVGNSFTDMTRLEILDLSFNSFSGDLPSSFGSLLNFHFLYLQHNQFTGSVNYLANLPLKNLNIEKNNFSGYVPKQFELIPELRINENQFEPHFLNRTKTMYPPLRSADKNVSHTPKATYKALHQRPHNKSTVPISPMATALGSVFVSFVIFLAVFLVVQRAHNEGSKHISMERMHSSSRLEMAEINPRRSRKRNLPLSRQYFASDLSTATNYYSREAFLGTGPLGSVFKAKFPDGQVLAVKLIEVLHISEEEQEEFLELVSTMSVLKHPNICILQGCCMDPGRHALLYDYAHNGSLYRALFSKKGDTQKPLSWKLRLRIALGVAHALEYMHEICSPPIAHGNIKARNVLLDEEFVPHVTDFGLTMLSRKVPVTSVDFKRSKGYTAPEMKSPYSDVIKGDIFSFGILLLELLTGHKAFDRITDPAISDVIPSRALSELADLILLCIQPMPQFRVSMSEVADMLASLIKKAGFQHHNQMGPGRLDEPPIINRRDPEVNRGNTEGNRGSSESHDGNSGGHTINAEGCINNDGGNEAEEKPDTSNLDRELVIVVGMITVFSAAMGVLVPRPHPEHGSWLKIWNSYALTVSDIVVLGSLVVAVLWCLLVYRGRVATTKIGCGFSGFSWYW